MSSQEQVTAQRAMSEIATAEGLADRFAKVFESFEAGDDVFSPDALFELSLPVLRLRLRGPQAFATRLKRIVGGDAQIDVLRTVPTMSGFVTEHEEHRYVDGKERNSRRLWLCEVRDGRIAEAVGYEV